MPANRHPHSVRFSHDEWDSITHAAEANKIPPGEYVREAAIRAAAELRSFSDAHLTPELIELMKRTFRGVHVLAYLKREQLRKAGEQDRFRCAATAAESAQSETLSASNST